MSLFIKFEQLWWHSMSNGLKKPYKTCGTVRQKFLREILVKSSAPSFNHVWQPISRMRRKHSHLKKSD